MREHLSTLLVLAQAGGSPAKPKGGEPAQVVIWVGILIVAIIALWVIVQLVRKRMLGASDAAASESLFADLRRMRAAGEMSDAEYEAARKALAARIAGKKDVVPKPETGTAKPRPRTDPPSPGADRRAPPGYDLTGAPLPKKKGTKE